MNVFSLFSGIGAFEKGLQNLGIPFELVGFSEIDAPAVKSYCAIHNVDESLNYGDITKIDEKALPKDIDLMTYGFPCQDISLAGKQQGLFNEDGTQTRSGLFFEALRIIEATQPKVAIAENVKNLTSKKFEKQFEIVLKSLEEAGYTNYWQVLNAKDYGIPQNRERVFIISIRKDIDNGEFKFPEGFPLELRLKDMLEDVVDEKYYLSNKMKNYLSVITEKNKARGNGNIYSPADVDGVSKTITTKEGSRVKDNFIEEPTVKQIGNCCPTATRENPNQGRVYDTDGLCPTLNQMQGGNRQPMVINVGNVNPSKKGQNGQVVDSLGIARTITTEKGEGQKVLVREATKQGYSEAVEGDSINLEHPNSKTRRGRVGHGVAQILTTSPQQGVVEADKSAKVINPLKGKTPNGWHFEQNIYNAEGITRAMKAGGGSGNIPKVIENEPPSLRIRKLTPKECFRLMGFSDEDFAKAEAVNSNTQLYKQAGNSIVVNVVEAIIKSLIECGVFDAPVCEPSIEEEIATPHIEPPKTEGVCITYQKTICIPDGIFCGVCQACLSNDMPYCEMTEEPLRKANNGEVMKSIKCFEKVCDALEQIAE